MENRQADLELIERRKQPINIYIDTNELLFKDCLINLPLLQTLGMLNSVFDFGVYICEVVRGEVIKNASIGLNKEIKSAKQMSDQLSGLNIIAPLDLPNEIFENEVREKVDNQFEKNGIKIIPLSILKTNDYSSMVSDAINYVPPFEEQHEKGFKDECIIKSYINFIKENGLEKAANFMLSRDDKVIEALENRSDFSFLLPIKDLQQSLPKQNELAFIEKADLLEKTLQESSQTNEWFLRELMNYLSYGPYDATGNFESLEFSSIHKTTVNFYNIEAHLGLATFHFCFRGTGYFEYISSYDRQEMSSIVGSANGKGSATMLFNIDENGKISFPNKPVFSSETSIDIDSIDVDSDYYRDSAENQDKI
jgi:hypothetical protein